MGIKFYDSNGKYWGEYDETKNLFIPSEEPITKTETQNSNLTFEKRTMRDCYNCKRYETEGECIECHYEPKDDTPQTDCKTCKYGQDKHRYEHICNECGVGINNYTPQNERRE